jgi:type I restriction enzyme, S subunit
LQNSSAKLLPIGTLLVAMYGSIGKLGITGIECATNQAIAFCRPNEAVVSLRYLYHALFDAKPRLLALGQGGAQQNISQSVLKVFQIPLAPKNEQTRIANQLDTLLARVQACNDRFDAIPALLKRFRQTVLGAATNGRLTAEWRTDPQAKKWIACTVGQVLSGKPRNGYSPQAVDYETPIRSLTLSATTSGKFLGRHSKFIAEPIADDSHLWLEPGDILIQRANSLEYVGVSAIFDGLKKQFIYPDLMMKCRPNERIGNKYLFYALSAESTRIYFRENATGTAGNMPKINQQTVMSAPLLLPPLDEQAEIVRRVEALFALADRIEVRCTAARAQAQRLTPLVLAKAFRGELVPQDPTDEPASALLARIASSNTGVVGKNKQKVPVARKERAQAAINL